MKKIEKHNISKNKNHIRPGCDTATRSKIVAKDRADLRGWGPSSPQNNFKKDSIHPTKSKS